MSPRPHRLPANWCRNGYRMTLFSPRQNRYLPRKTNHPLCLLPTPFVNWIFLYRCIYILVTFCQSKCTNLFFLFCILRTVDSFCYGKSSLFRLRIIGSILIPSIGSDRNHQHRNCRSNSGKSPVMSVFFPACGCPVFAPPASAAPPRVSGIRHGNLLCGSVYFLFPFFQVLFLHILTSIPSAVFPSAATPDVLSTAQYSHSLQESVQSPASYIHRRHAFPQSCGPPHPS